MGDSISEGTIVEWAKQPGDSVEVDDVVVVLETDKVGPYINRLEALLLTILLFFVGFCLCGEGFSVGCQKFQRYGSAESRSM